MTIFRHPITRDATYIAGHLLQSGIRQLGIDSSGRLPEYSDQGSKLSGRDPLQLFNLEEVFNYLTKIAETHLSSGASSESFAYSPAPYHKNTVSTLQLLFLSSQSLREGLHYIEKFSALLIDQTPVEVTRHKDGNIRVRLHTQYQAENKQHRWVIELLISTLLSWFQQLCGNRLTPTMLHLPWGDDKLAEHYQTCWKTKALMGTPDCMIELPSDCLECGEYHSHPAISQLLLSDVENQYRRLIRKASLAESLAHAFDSGAITLNAEQNEVAQHYNISARTLNRYLKKEGTSLKQIATQSRITVAKRLLTETDEPIHNISRKVKLSGRRALDRVFISTEGVTPARYRELNKPAKGKSS